MTGIPKRKPYRNKKILKAARGQPCTLSWPGCNRNPQTTVFAHFNDSWAGKGMAQKADDCAGVFACSHCHALYDSGVFDSITLYYGYVMTLKALSDIGLIDYRIPYKMPVPMGKQEDERKRLYLWALKVLTA